MGKDLNRQSQGASLRVKYLRNRRFFQLLQELSFFY